MIGVLIVTHGKLGCELIRTAEMIVGPLEGIATVNVERAKGVEDLKKEIEKGIQSVDRGGGVLILTDMFGGTPSNLSLAHMEEGSVEVVTGVNLPMILKLSLEKRRGPLKEFAEYVCQYGQRSISLASEILKMEVKASKGGKR